MKRAKKEVFNLHMFSLDFDTSQNRVIIFTFDIAAFNF